MTNEQFPMNNGVTPLAVPLASVLSPEFVDDAPGLSSIPPTPGACTHPSGGYPMPARPYPGSVRSEADLRAGDGLARGRSVLGMDLRP